MKAIYFIYGVVCYVFFLGVFLYSIGFIGNIYVPKSIDVGGDSMVLEAFIVNSVLLTLFVVQHAVMARPAFKRWWTRIIPQPMERSTYVLATNIVMILLFWQWRPITDVVWNAENSTVVMVLWGLFVLGWMIVFLSTFMIDHFNLFELKQVSENLHNTPPRPLTFTKKIFLPSGKASTDARVYHRFLGYTGNNGRASIFCHYDYHLHPGIHKISGKKGSGQTAGGTLQTIPKGGTDANSVYERQDQGIGRETLRL